MGDVPGELLERLVEQMLERVGGHVAVIHAPYDPELRARFRFPTDWERLEAWLWLKRQRDKAFEERMNQAGDELLVPGEVEFHLEGDEDDDDDPDGGPMGVH